VLFGERQEDGSTMPSAVDQANGGTLFLKDVDMLTPAPLDRLLNMLQKQSTAPIPGKSIHPVRLIGGVTDTPDPEERQRKLNLFHKLNAVEITIPPLRDRREDIIPVTVFLMSKKMEAGKNIPTIKADAKSCLLHYRWPGNISELGLTVEHILTHLENGNVTKASLPPRIQNAKEVAAAPRDDHPSSKQKALKSFLSKPLMQIRQRTDRSADS
jgi:DNA-binding NtrC family response regulator